VDEVRVWTTKFEPILQSHSLSYIGTLNNYWYFGDKLMMWLSVILYTECCVHMIALWVTLFGQWAAA